jgi:hypothetical protein
MWLLYIVVRIFYHPSSDCFLSYFYSIAACYCLLRNKPIPPCDRSQYFSLYWLFWNYILHWGPYNFVCSQLSCILYLDICRTNILSSAPRIKVYNKTQIFYMIWFPTSCRYIMGRPLSCLFHLSVIFKYILAKKVHWNEQLFLILQISYSHPLF